MSYVKRQLESTPNRRRSYTQMNANEEQWLKQWTENQIIYWREKLKMLNVYDTGALQSDITGILSQGNITTISHKFLMYGIFVEAGTGREFAAALGSRGGEGTINDGQLPFLLPGGEEYRRIHGLNKPKKVGPAWGGRIAGGHPRQAKLWFSKKYHYSVMRLAEHELAFYGETYCGLTATALQEMFGRIGGSPVRNL